ncbi:MAG: ATP-binding cassette domain-containing protein, partial [Gemmataceae bacterium]
PPPQSPSPNLELNMPTLTLNVPTTPTRSSLNATRVMQLFGIAPHEPAHNIITDLQIDFKPGQILFITGESGSGKSTVLRALAQHHDALNIRDLQLPEQTIIDWCADFASWTGTLARCGLAEPRLWLRTPAELSDGQRERLRFAWAIQSTNHPSLVWDEFAAILDRPLAQMLARNVRKLATQTGRAILLATTHDDLQEALQPDQHLLCGPNPLLTIHTPEGKKKC